LIDHHLGLALGGLEHIERHVDVHPADGQRRLADDGFALLDLEVEHAVYAVNRHAQIGRQRVGGHLRGYLFQLLFHVVETADDYVADAVSRGRTTGQLSAGSLKVWVSVIFEKYIRFGGLTYGHRDVVVGVFNHAVGYLLKHDVF